MLGVHTVVPKADFTNAIGSSHPAHDIHKCEKFLPGGNQNHDVTALSNHQIGTASGEVGGAAWIVGIGPLISIQFHGLHPSKR